MPSAPRIAKIIIIYDANGSIPSELRFWVGKYILQDRHCAACDVTHGTFSEKAEFKACKARLKVPVAQLHRDELDKKISTFLVSQPKPALAAVLGELQPAEPPIDGETTGQLVYLLGPKELDAFGGNVTKFEHGLREKIGKMGLAL